MVVSLFRLSKFVFNEKWPFLSRTRSFMYKLANFQSQSQTQFSTCSSCSSAKLLISSQFQGQGRRQGRKLDVEMSAGTKCGYSTLTAQPHFLAIGHLEYKNQCACFYSKKARSKKSAKRAEDTDDDESEDEDDKDDFDAYDSEDDDDMDGAKKDWKDLKMNVPSLRIDAVLSTGLGVSRKKIEDAFLSGKLRHNGKKVMKKSRQVQEGDILDVVKEDQFTKKDGGQVMLVMRVEMKKIKEEKTSSDKTPVKLRRWKHLELPREK